MSRRAQTTPSRSGAARPSRRHAWLLVVLAAVLAADGPVPGASPARVAGDAEVRGEPRGGEPEPTAGIAHVLRRANPSLSAAEVERISEAVVRYGSKYRLAPDLVTAVLLVESGARPWAVSPMGARGLMQVMPHMMRPMGMVGNLSTIETNIEAGCIILADNIRRLGESDGISAYFWGSSIRGDGYLDRVQAARAQLRRAATSS
jgi:soluble lytic murein transglycosylase-like protein